MSICDDPVTCFVCSAETEGSDMEFRVVARSQRDRESGVVYLTHTGWDDWFKFSTLYDVEYVDEEGTNHSIGTTKIGKFGLQPSERGPDLPDDARRPNPPATFGVLDDRFFSLGQDSEFYECLSRIGDSFRETFLRALRDVAYDPVLLSQTLEEPVMGVSLLRTVPLPTVRDQFHRLAHGGARLTSYKLGYRLTYSKTNPAPAVRFEVTPGSKPPTNVHVIVGRNGVGKSTFLNNLARHFVRKNDISFGDGQPELGTEASAEITNLVSVSFSAFDSFEPLSVSRDRGKGLTYHYVGLKKRRIKSDDPESIKGPTALAREMTQSSRICFEGARRARWLEGLRLLESDPIFASAGIADVIEHASDIAEVLDEISIVFKKLSSGHKIVLLTVTKLVETVEEKSLVLLDEPEAHLHPPLLSAFLRALSTLLVNRNGVAIVATHSPVVLQEVPRTCVWKLDRTGEFTTVERPQLETFGENVGTLTNEVFGLEVTSTGFHKMLWDAALEHQDYDFALATFGGQIGTEGKAILRAMTNSLEISSNVVR